MRPKPVFLRIYAQATNAYPKIVYPFFLDMCSLNIRVKPLKSILTLYVSFAHVFDRLKAVADIDLYSLTCEVA